MIDNLLKKDPLYKQLRMQEKIRYYLIGIFMCFIFAIGFTIGVIL